MLIALLQLVHCNYARPLFRRLTERPVALIVWVDARMPTVRYIEFVTYSIVFMRFYVFLVFTCVPLLETTFDASLIECLNQTTGAGGKIPTATETTSKRSELHASYMGPSSQTPKMPELNYLFMGPSTQKIKKTSTQKCWMELKKNFSENELKTMKMLDASFDQGYMITEIICYPILGTPRSLQH